LSPSESAEIYNGNTITNHPGSGVAAVISPGSVSYSTITGNGDGGVQAYLGSTLVIMEGTTISNNNGNGVRLNTNSTGQITGATIQNNTGPGIWLLFASKLQLGQPTSNVTGNGGFGLECRDAESSVYD